jgi:hypothetical protein
MAAVSTDITGDNAGQRRVVQPDPLTQQLGEAEARALQELAVLEARRISMRDKKEQWYKVSAKLITADPPD